MEYQNTSKVGQNASNGSGTVIENCKIILEQLCNQLKEPIESIRKCEEAMSWSLNHPSFKGLAEPKNAEDSKDEHGFCRELSTKLNEDVSEDRDHQSIWEELLNTRHFRIKPQVISVFMVPSVRSHPNAIGDIPWPWLREEKWRLHTFSNYPQNTAKSAILLAEDGFAYIGSGKGSDDSVICFFCCSTKKGWHASDVISVVHRELSPDCPMVTKVNCNNIPMATPQDGSDMFSRLFNNDRDATNEDLGIITQRPKRCEFARRATRLETFEHWPRDHHLKKEDLSAAGFYYVGDGDHVRCFYCGVGVRNWTNEDNVWIEHARLSEFCSFVLLSKRQAFVDTVQDLKGRGHNQITYEMVMGESPSLLQLDTNIDVKRHPAVKAVVDMGYAEKDVLEAINHAKEQNKVLSADTLVEKLVEDEIQRVTREPAPDTYALDPNKEKEKMEARKDQNHQLRQQTVCKICRDNEVAVVFLPCGHLVSCTDCAVAMKDCPVCRNHIKWIVQARM